jgi:hypothetical protein
MIILLIHFKQALLHLKIQFLKIRKYIQIFLLK